MAAGRLVGLCPRLAKNGKPDPTSTQAKKLRRLIRGRGEKQYNIAGGTEGRVIYCTGRQSKEKGGGRRKYTV